MGEPITRSQWNANTDAWTAMSRSGADVYRDVVNTPAFLALLPDIAGRRCLDVGCGEGHNTRLLAARGAAVIGLDHAETFITHARAAPARATPAPDGGVPVDAGGIRYLVGDGAVLPFASGTFDVVTAFMSLMDVGDPEATLAEVARVLRPGGFVQFSVTHPINGTPFRCWVDDDAGERTALAIGGYFDEGPLTESWTFGAASADLRDRHDPFTITSERRTLAGWLNAVAVAGLVIDQVAEPRATAAQAAADPRVADTRIVPYFLLVRAHRP